MRKLTALLVVGGTLALANPYPDESAVPKDKPWNFPAQTPGRVVNARALRAWAPQVLRVDLDWVSSLDEFQIAYVAFESSGTPALLRRAARKDSLGSYHATLFEASSGKTLSYASVGTGSEFRKLTRALSFRFPRPSAPVEFVLEAENPVTGKMELVFRQWLDPAQIPAPQPAEPPDFEVRQLKLASIQPSLALTLYADGYSASGKATFFKDAQRVVDTLKQNSFPMFEQFDFHAVFGTSQKALGSAQNLGMPIPERDSFLGLYFPYWDNFGRWYNIVYPTREKRFRTAVGLVPYDYPFAIVDSGSYWGVGNFNELTAIPSRNSSFTYLLLHEFGHFFGLNEEYEGGGPTELQFAEGIEEPWSQNITFLKDPSKLKWKSLISASTPIPTPSSQWTGSGPYGAYRGGYADSAPQGHSHKPGQNCTMKSGGKFCPVCTDALKAKILFDLGT